MPRIQIPVTRPGAAGANPAEVQGDAANDHYFVNDGRTVLVIRNAGAGPTTVTVVSAAAPGGLALADVDRVIPAAETHVLGPYDPWLFNQPDGTVHVDVTSADPRIRALSTAS